MFVGSNYKFEITISRITIQIITSYLVILHTYYQIHTKYTPNIHQIHTNTHKSDNIIWQ